MELEELRKKIKEDELDDFDKNKDSFEKEIILIIEEELRNKDLDFKEKFITKILKRIIKAGHLFTIIDLAFKTEEFMIQLQNKFGLYGDSEEENEKIRSKIIFFLACLLGSFLGIVTFILMKIF